MARGDQDLVPRNLPYGGRQQYVQNAQQAGVPLSSRSAPPPGPAATAAPGAGRGTDQLITPDLDIFAQANPADFAGADLSPEGQLEAADQQMIQIAVSSPNPLARAIAATYLRRQQERRGRG